MLNYNRDFEVFWAHYEDRVPYSKAEALVIYNEVFTCECTGCKYNKEKGTMPVHVHPQCTLPIDAYTEFSSKLGLNHANSNK